MQYRSKESSVIRRKKEGFDVIREDYKKVRKVIKMSMEIKNLDHLGLVAGIIDEIGIADKINVLIGEKKSEKISSGKVVKAMI